MKNVRCTYIDVMCESGSSQHNTSPANLWELAARDVTKRSSEAFTLCSRTACLSQRVLLGRTQNKTKIALLIVFLQTCLFCPALKDNLCYFCCLQNKTKKKSIKNPKHETSNKAAKKAKKMMFARAVESFFFFKCFFLVEVGDGRMKKTGKLRVLSEWKGRGLKWHFRPIHPLRPLPQL